MDLLLTLVSAANTVQANSRVAAAPTKEAASSFIDNLPAIEQEKVGIIDTLARLLSPVFPRELLGRPGGSKQGLQDFRIVADAPRQLPLIQMGARIEFLHLIRITSQASVKCNHRLLERLTGPLRRRQGLRQ